MDFLPETIDDVGTSSFQTDFLIAFLSNASLPPVLSRENRVLKIQQCWLTGMFYKICGRGQ